MNLLAFLPDFVWHPLGACPTHPHWLYVNCRSYNLWSGVVSDVGEITLVGGLITIVYGLWRKHNCHVHRCWRLAWHVDQAHGHPVCKRHHPDHPKGGGGGLEALGHAPAEPPGEEEGMATKGSWVG